MDGDVRRRRPSVSDNGNRRGQRNNYNGDREELAHGFGPVRLTSLRWNWLLGLKCKIRSRRLAGADRHLLCLGAITFLPGGQSVIPGRSILDCKRAVIVADAVGALDER